MTALHERPTRDERAASAAHDPRACAHCSNAALHGDQADLDEIETERRIKAAVQAAREACARVADLEAERIKHSAMFFGLGNPPHEAVCFRIAAAIRALGGGA